MEDSRWLVLVEYWLLVHSVRAGVGPVTHVRASVGFILNLRTQKVGSESSRRYDYGVAVSMDSIARPRRLVLLRPQREHGYLDTHTVVGGVTTS